MFKLSNPRLECPIPDHIQAEMHNVNDWNFDIFKLNEISGGHALKYIGFKTFNHYGFLNRFKIPINVVDSFLTKMEAGYSKHGNPYHNLVHGADVAQASHHMISSTGLGHTLAELEVFATLFSAIIHDYEHTGHTNNFHVQSGSDIALIYNDRSVLENHHISASFRVCRDPESSLLTGLSRDEFREFRNLVIEIVLATDMSTHFAQIKQMKSMITLPEVPDKIKILSLMVHSCDISHPSRPWDLHYKWTHCVTEEFFRQGDIEASLGLPYSPLCDRNSVHIAESQIGFIDFIVEPSFLICGEMLTKVMEPYVTNLVNEGGEVDDGFVEGGVEAASMRSLSSRWPLDAEGRPQVPQPWVELIHSNKAEWKTRAAKDKAEREAKLAAQAPDQA